MGFPPYKTSCSPLSLSLLEDYVSHLNAIGPPRQYRGSARADECFALCSGPKLAAAVARGGGLGFLSGANRTPAEITKEFADTKELMGKGKILESQLNPSSALAIPFHIHLSCW